MSVSLENMTPGESLLEDYNEADGGDAECARPRTRRASTQDQ